MEKKLRVGFVSIQDASSVATWSGIPLNLLQHLRRHPDVDVELISPLGENLKWLYLPLILMFKAFHHGFDWQREALSLRYFASRIESVFRNKKLDVVFSTSSIPVTRLTSSVPTVFWTDGSFQTMEDYYQTGMPQRTRRVGRMQEEKSIRRASFACYSSDWAANGARAITDRERVKVLPFGPNLRIEHNKLDVEGWIRERRVARPHACVLLFVGIDWVRKGGGVAIESARRLNEAGIATTLRVVGGAPPGPTPDFVEYLGFIDKNEPEGYRRLVDLYRTSDIFILPSRAEAFGVVVSEAAAFGLPALVCDTGGLAETVSESVSGFRLPLDDDGTLFAEKAKIILRAYEAFANNAFAEFENRLNWETSASLLVDLLKRAANDAR